MHFHDGGPIWQWWAGIQEWNECICNDGGPSKQWRASLQEKNLMHLQYMVGQFGNGGLAYKKDWSAFVMMAGWVSKGGLGNKKKIQCIPMMVGQYGNGGLAYKNEMNAFVMRAGWVSNGGLVYKKTRPTIISRVRDLEIDLQWLRMAYNNFVFP